MLQLETIYEWAIKEVQNKSFSELRAMLKTVSFPELVMVWDIVTDHCANTEFNDKNQGAFMFHGQVQAMLIDRILTKENMFMVRNDDTGHPIVHHKLLEIDILSDEDLANSLAENYRNKGFKNVSVLSIDKSRMENFCLINARILGVKGFRINTSRSSMKADDLIINNKTDHEVNPDFTVWSAIFLQEVRRKALDKSEMDVIASKYYPLAREAVMFVPMVVKDDYGTLINTTDREQMLTGKPFTYVSQNFGEYIPVYTSTYELNGFSDDKSVSGYMHVRLEDLMRYELPVVIDRENIFDVWSLNDMKNSAKRR